LYAIKSDVSILKCDMRQNNENQKQRLIHSAPEQVNRLLNISEVG